jgi:hypothetical protein
MDLKIGTDTQHSEDRHRPLNIITITVNVFSGTSSKKNRECNKWLSGFSHLYIVKWDKHVVRHNPSWIYSGALH